MDIISQNDDILIVNKPAGVPSQSDMGGDADALTLAREQLRDSGEPHSLWIVHRLDRVVGGLLLLARNKSAAAKLSAAFAENKIEKKYLAVVEGRLPDGTLKDFLRRDARMGRAFVCDGGHKDAKAAELSVKTLSSVNTDKGELSLLLVTLRTGRFHQIRAQLSARGTPIVGDGKYGSRIRAQYPALFCHSLKAELLKSAVNVAILPDNRLYPWSLFESLAPFSNKSDSEDIS